MPPLCGIGQILHYVMMQYSLRHASTMHLKDEIQWPTPKKILSLGAHLGEISGCIGFIDDTMIAICKF
jgi:hypothetical protein